MADIRHRDSKVSGELVAPMPPVGVPSSEKSAAVKRASTPPARRPRLQESRITSYESRTVVGELMSVPATLPLHYDDKYFTRQGKRGEFGGWANLTKFQQYIRPEHRVLDFGCGGGFLLSRLECAERRGIEINPAARRQAQQLGVMTTASAEAVQAEWADVIISNSALEHCENPLAELRTLVRLVKRGGRMVFVVPCQPGRARFQAKDPDQHLYSWNPQLLGNLFERAGLVVEESHAYVHRWPSKIYRYLPQWMGRTGFEIACRIWGVLTLRRGYQVRIVARRPLSTVRELTTA
jgi:SAM-dependent methyltransferase